MTPSQSHFFIAQVASSVYSAILPFPLASDLQIVGSGSRANPLDFAFSVRGSNRAKLGSQGAINYEKYTSSGQGDIGHW